MRAWRIVKARHQAQAFDGKGARRYGGRFNERGQRAVYASQALSLAALEILVHTGVDERQLRFVKFAIDLPDATVRTYTPADMPADWDVEPPAAAVQQWGSEQLNEHGILRFPSVIIPEEFNLVIAPNHHAFETLVIAAAKPFHWDRRLSSN